MKSTLLTTLAVLALSAVPTVATAQVEQPSQITFQGTALISKDSSTSSTSHGASQSGGFLVGYSYQFSRWAGVEGNYGFSRNTQNYAGGFGSSSIRSDIHQATGAFVFHAPLRASNVRPYALGGGGALVFDPTGTASSGFARQTKGTFVYGGGLDVDVARNIGVRAEYRGLLFKTPDFSDPNLNLDKFSHIAQPSVGFFVRF